MYLGESRLKLHNFPPEPRVCRDDIYAGKGQADNPLIVEAGGLKVARRRTGNIAINGPSGAVWKCAIFADFIKKAAGNLTGDPPRFQVVFETDHYLARILGVLSALRKSYPPFRRAITAALRAIRDNILGCTCRRPDPFSRAQLIANCWRAQDTNVPFGLNPVGVLGGDAHPESQIA